MNYSNENKINTSDKSNGFNNSIRADINLYLDFFENYNKNDFDICLKILNSSKFLLLIHST